MPDFSKAQVGDSVYDIRYGEGTIRTINNSRFPIEVVFDSGEHETFTIEGQYSTNQKNPTLYWARPTISDPPPPKRKVKKNGWLNVYPCDTRAVWSTKSKADQEADDRRVACVPIEWEEEE